MLLDLLLGLVALVVFLLVVFVAVSALVGAGGAVALGRFSERLFDLFVRKKPNDLGPEGVVGKTATAVQGCSPSSPEFPAQCTVRVGGEIWSASSSTSLVEGQVVEVVAVQGLILEVSPRPAGVAA